MSDSDQKGLIGQHLVPGEEYYFERRPAYFDSSYPQSPPVSAEVVEPQSEFIIRAVLENQKIDWGVYYLRVREEFKGTVDLARKGIVVNGDYFFTPATDGSLDKQLTIDEALRVPVYIKITVYLQRVRNAEVVRRTEENRNKFSYWDLSGRRKEMKGFDIKDGKREDWRECYSEFDSDHAPCR